MNLKRVNLYDRVVALRNSVLILPVFIAFLSVSCIKESSLLGTGNIPPGDKIQTFYTDTINVYSSIVTIDSVASYHLAQALFGSYKDPIFGVSTANAVIQVSPLILKFRYGTSPVADSVILNIKYNFIYGNRASTVHFNVYELNNLFNAALTPRHWDTIPYYSNFDITPHLGTQIGQFSYSPAGHPSDSLIKVNLSAYFGNKMIVTDTLIQDSLPLFHNYMEGICIIPDKATSSGDGFIFKTNLASAYFDISVYYHNSLLTSDSVARFIVIDEDRDARINTFSHDYTSAKFYSSIDKNHITDTLTYIESMAGVLTRLTFPGLAALKKKPSDIISINKAELIIPVGVDNISLYPPVPQMQFLRKGTDGTFLNTPDYSFFFPTSDPSIWTSADTASAKYVGGAYDQYNNNYVSYLNKHFEYYFSQPGYNPDLYLRPLATSALTSPGRSILKNGTGANKMKLKVTYTKR